MATPAISHERQVRIKETIEAALRDGWNPRGQSLGGKGSCIYEALRRLHAAGYTTETHNTLNRFVDRQLKLKARGENHMCPDWSLFAKPGVEPGKLKAGIVHRWIVTAAQDDTDVHLGFWTNLNAYANYVSAELVVSGYTYQKKIWTKDEETRTNTFRPELRQRLRFEEMELGPVRFAAQSNIEATAVNPLSGMAPYSKGRDTIFPHPKVAYETVPQVMGTYVPSIMTTGTVTLPNYIRKKAGQKAEFHHIYGAVIVEVDAKGRAWCRHIIADQDGTFYDLDAFVKDGKVTRGHRVHAIVWGDIHVPYIEDDVIHALWGEHTESMIDVLRPRFQFFHDLLDFRMWSRHVKGDPIHRAEMHFEGTASMEDQVTQGTAFLRKSQREWCQSVVIESNHDQRLEQWVRQEPDRMDTENYIYWLKLNLAYMEALRDGDGTFNLVRHALRDRDAFGLEGIDFVPIGHSYSILPDTGGIECGMHGHLGPNGSKGSPTSLAKMGAKYIRGDAHSPHIKEGGVTVGMTGELDQRYNKGPSSWKRAHAVVYPNGKRTLITQANDGNHWRG